MLLIRLHGLLDILYNCFECYLNLFMSVNKVILIGHVGADPEMRYPEKTGLWLICRWPQMKSEELPEWKSLNGTPLYSEARTLL